VRGVAGRWPDRFPSSVAWGLLAAALGLLYFGVIGRWVQDWIYDPNYSHGLLVPPFAAWMIWSRRVELRALELRPSYLGAVVVAASLGLFLVGQAALEFFVTRLSLVGVVAGAIVQLAGWRHLRVCAFPLALFVLVIPVPALLYNQVAFPLQLLASRFGVATLDMLNIPAVREGNVILLERATLEVAEACSGVRSLISLGTLALVYGHVSRQPAIARAVLLVAVLPVVIVVNGLRVASTGAVAHIYGAATASGFLHTFSGWAFFVLAVVMLMVVERGSSALLSSVRTREATA
jgi:exosortase